MRGFVAELSDGSSFKEDTIHQALAAYVNMYGWSALRPWALLKKYLDLKNLKIVSLQLEYDHQGVFLPRHAKAYFYSKKVESFLGGPGTETLYYGVGATEGKNDEVNITWFDGFGSQIEKRKVDPNNASFITS